MKTFSTNSANSAKKTETRKSTFQLVLGLTFLLFYATTTQMQADSSEHAVRVVEAHLSAGDAAAEQLALQGTSTRTRTKENSAAATDVTNPLEKVRRDFNQNGSARVAASLQLDEKVDAEEIELQSGSFTQQMQASLSHMDENIDALITDMLSLQNQIRQSKQVMTEVKPKSKNDELADAMSALIEQAAHQKAVASNAGNFQSFAQAEQKVIKLHAQATRLASIRD